VQSFSSAFLDTDGFFGSSGSFFDASRRDWRAGGSFEANPPFVEESMQVRVPPLTAFFFIIIIIFFSLSICAAHLSLSLSLANISFSLQLMADVVHQTLEDNGEYAFPPVPRPRPCSHPCRENSRTQEPKSLDFGNLVTRPCCCPTSLLPSAVPCQA
jgi:hypothetical protein